MFYCREKELGDMNKRYTRSGFECLVVYGRRRVGKTALINEFCKDKPTVFFSALNATSQENLEALSKAIYEKEHPGAETAPCIRALMRHLLRSHAWLKLKGWYSSLMSIRISQGQTSQFLLAYSILSTILGQTAICFLFFAALP